MVFFLISYIENHSIALLYNNIYEINKFWSMFRIQIYFEIPFELAVSLKKTSCLAFFFLKNVGLCIVHYGKSLHFLKN